MLQQNIRQALKLIPYHSSLVKFPRLIEELAFKTNYGKILLQNQVKDQKHQQIKRGPSGAKIRLVSSIWIGDNIFLPKHIEWQTECKKKSSSIGIHVSLLALFDSQVFFRQSPLLSRRKDEAVLPEYPGRLL